MCGLVPTVIPKSISGRGQEMHRRLSILLLVAIAGVVVLVSTHHAFAGKDRPGNDRVLSRVRFIHYKKGHAKPPWVGGGKKDKDEGYYTYIASGACWWATEDYRLNATNADGVPAGSVEAAVQAGMDEWEAPAGVSFDIFGVIIPDAGVSYDDGAYRGYNTISFGSHDNPDVIGETMVWGYFTGPPKFREIVEAHVMLNDAFDWGDAEIDGTLMDIQNIMTHELGHCAGMGDLYDAVAVEETMYGYSTEGETKTRDLYTGDIEGISKLY
jgi:hypothetical protein